MGCMCGLFFEGVVMANNNNGPSQGPSTNPNNNSSNTNSSNINTNNASNTSTNSKKPTVPFLKIVPSPDKTALLKYKDDKLSADLAKQYRNFEKRVQLLEQQIRNDLENEFDENSENSMMGFVKNRAASLRAQLANN